MAPILYFSKLYLNIHCLLVTISYQFILCIIGTGIMFPNYSCHGISLQEGGCSDISTQHKWHLVSGNAGLVKGFPAPICWGFIAFVPFQFLTSLKTFLTATSRKAHNMVTFKQRVIQAKLVIMWLRTDNQMVSKNTFQEKSYNLRN